jgi:endogenous inhibitor of DNA gyrase (YacG/DUF329 family)
MSSNPDAKPALFCPICKRPVAQDNSNGGARSYFPFCSERCELIDLGRWLGGRYQVPVEDEEESDRPAEPPR